MGEFARRVVMALALLAGALVFWFVGDFLYSFTRSLRREVGPLWALAFVGVVTLVLAAVWIGYGGTGALRRWGVTIKPAVPPEPEASAPPSGPDADRDLGAAGRHGRSR